jgi:hypothetical protein
VATYSFSSTTSRPERVLSRDAWAVSSHQVRYEGPSSLAVSVATLLADAEGIELRSAEKQEPDGEPVEPVSLVLTVEGTTEAVTAAVGSIDLGLPPDARIRLEGPGRTL